jgi:anti-sigma regulatory factor (Ser/Thr protein kinase)
MESGVSPEEQFPAHDFDPDKLSLRVRVTLAADRNSVDPVVSQVMEAVRDMKCVNGKEDAIELSLQEALANAVVHGAKEDPSKIIECLVACDEQRGILIIVRDPGP